MASEADKQKRGQDSCRDGCRTDAELAWRYGQGNQPEYSGARKQVRHAG